VGKKHAFCSGRLAGDNNDFGSDIERHDAAIVLRASSKRIEQIRVARDAVSSAGVTMPWRNRSRSSLKSDLPVGTRDKKRGG
jgi:hypothetical protein